MIAYLCSSGEKTTQICKEQLLKFGFKVVMLDMKESWEDKYKRFINLADDDCIRIDADVVPNKYIKILAEFGGGQLLMIQGQGYDFYKNDEGVIGITYYNKKAIEIIRNNWDKLDLRRPEASAWRLPEINNLTYTALKPMGIHGFFQTMKDLERHKQHKIDRKQIEDYDFEMANKLLNLNNN